MTTHFEVIIFVDPRFPGGTSTAVCAEIDALAAEGVTPGLCLVLSPVLSGWRSYHPGIQERIETGQVVIIDTAQPCQANLLLIHHPLSFLSLPAAPVQVRAEKSVLVVHEPPLNGHGGASYPLEDCLRNATETFGTRPILAPVGPTVRTQLLGMSLVDYSILPEDWVNLINFADWPEEARDGPATPMRIGRHSRPQLSKWPDTREQAVAAYPEDTKFDIRFLGTPSGFADHYLPLPHNWTLLPFQNGAEKAFLRDLDVFVYYHGSEWIEAFGYAILEALAAGLPTILPENFRSLFGDAAIYAPIEGVRAVLEQLTADPVFYQDRARQARSVAEQQFSITEYPKRLDRLFPGWRDRLENATSPRPNKKRVLMVTSNGVGAGHITRLLAVAERFEPDFEVAFLTMSLAFKAAMDRGYLTQYIPFHRYLNIGQEHWNDFLALETTDFFNFYRPDVVVFDGNFPYGGLLRALAGKPEIKSVWMRRAMWGNKHRDALPRAAAFDAVIEPGEISGRFDVGPTTEQADAVFRTDPVIAIDADMRLPRTEARKNLGLSEGVTAVAIMLGADNNYDRGSVRARLIDRLLEQPNLRIIEFRSPVTIQNSSDTRHPNHEVRQVYPVFPLSNAFDFFVAGAGYNSFHETVAGCLPTIFIPNEAPEMDLQLTRAQHLAAIGAAQLLRTSDIVKTGPTVAHMLDREHREQMRQKLAGLAFDNGATTAANFIQQLATGLKCLKVGE